MQKWAKNKTHKWKRPNESNAASSRITICNGHNPSSSSASRTRCCITIGNKYCYLNGCSVVGFVFCAFSLGRDARYVILVFHLGICEALLRLHRWRDGMCILIFFPSPSLTFPSSRTLNLRFHFIILSLLGCCCCCSLRLVFLCSLGCDIFFFFIFTSHCISRPNQSCCRRRCTAPVPILFHEDCSCYFTFFFPSLISYLSCSLFEPFFNWSHGRSQF